ncbi:MAG TPA: hypothetical protein VMF57_07930 [Solirubrobacteraceae bacterium]|nr:hypothetical protein [Solirubrobacteraceae bacterium]
MSAVQLIEPSAGETARRARWRGVGLAITAIVLAWAFAPFILVALDAAAHHRVFLGVAGYYPMDGLQYLAWVRDAHDGLIRNLYGSLGKAVFVHPMYSLSGVVQGAFGVGSVAIMAFWKALAALVLVGGCLALVTRYIPSGQVGRRAAALVLALFGGFTPVVGLLAWLDPWQRGSDFARAAGDLVPAMSLWDYAPLAIALGLMPIVIERIERLVTGRSDRRTTVVASAAGLLVAWLHPWQGITLIALTGGLVLWRALEARSPRGSWVERWGIGAVRGQAIPLAVVTGATALPVLYYMLLSHLDAGWATSEQNSVGAAVIPGLVTLTCVVPLALAGLLAARRTARDPRTRVLLLWLLATLFTITISPSGQYRALDGVAIPVALLVVRAWPARPLGGRRRLLAVAAVAATLVPFAVFAVEAFGHLRSPEVTAYTELARSDVRAARVAAARAGAAPVLAPAELGTAIPALTDAVSWVGHPIWTPDYTERKDEAMLLFAGAMTPGQARRFVRSTGARALVEPCGSTGNLQVALAPLGFRVITVGCARVYAR